MITKFKIYEECNIDEFLPIYKVGDYLIMWADNRRCKVVEIESTPGREYRVETIITGQKIVINLMYYNIKRKMTPEEIEQYEIELEAEKYNI